ncbi:hypothetical protein V1514DRAFT_317818 [Lipomyces japonicus]|uniref:uncharacterized protein n=1 Tax=Lipomyces japonicus TaxID=56871 RepID=UPI0034CDEBE4
MPTTRATSSAEPPATPAVATPDSTPASPATVSWRPLSVSDVTICGRLVCPSAIATDSANLMMRIPSSLSSDDRRHQSRILPALTAITLPKLNSSFSNFEP